ncbi:angiopoietin-4-like [Haliotis rubra]|uniref:angiopoietin-4-like n=1 Tax=Haliotis rubra TaxID=36100 RepID=UPI001EE5CE8F|nr:angiopoietin-4-like [Haliotis rubra]
MSAENRTCSLITMSRLQNMNSSDVTYRQVGHDCSEGFRTGATGKGVFTIEPDSSSSPFQVYCDLRFGGRTYIQRQDYGINFNRTWRDYREGFGNVTGDHWLGFEKIRAMNDRAICQFVIRLTYNPRCCPTYRQANFKHFKLTDEDDGYRLTFDSLTAGQSSKNRLTDMLTEVKGAKFSTYDRDNDDNPTGSCSQIHGAGWWFKNCTRCNPNGRLNPDAVNVSADPEEVFWDGDPRRVSGVHTALQCK